MDTERDADGTCYICQHDAAVLETHHIVPRRYGGTDADHNLVDLCRNCHGAIERLYDDSFYERLGVEKPDEEEEDASKDIHYCSIGECTSLETSPLESEHGELTVWVCDGHRECMWKRVVTVASQIGPDIETCDRRRVTPVNSTRDEGRFVLLCEEHRVCQQKSCRNTDIDMYVDDFSGKPRYLCETHATDSGLRDGETDSGSA